ncbi:MAG: hypothetical protein H0T76_14635 [Nannocystis sp.]|nr:hypothetical protein [Nannocystis sp.]MBA3547719.1 hypothetical protein [Nannocystis sp.]
MLFSSTLALACTKKEDPKPTATAATAGAPAVPGTPGTPAVVAGPAALPMGTGDLAVSGGGTISGLSAEPEVLGHFVLVNASQLLVDVKTQLVPPQYASMLDEAALRAMVAIALDKRGDLARNYDLAAPLGCALVDLAPADPKLSCVFGYRGGAKAFIGDLGEENRNPDGGGHTAAYGLEGKVAYIDALGDGVVVSSGADTFGKTQGYLQRNIVDRAGKIHGDLEIVMYVSTIFDRYRSVLEPLINARNTQTPPMTGNPAVDGMMQAFSSYSQRSGQSTAQRISEISQASAFFSLEPEGLAIGAVVFPKAGTRMAEDMAKYGTPQLDPAFAGTAPSGTAMMFAFAMTPQPQPAPSMIDARKMMAEGWGALTGRDAVAIEAAIAAFQSENAALYDGHTLMALGREPGALFGFEVASRLQSGKSARDAWKVWSAGFTPEAVLGAEFSKFVTWSFTPDAATVDGVAVDRWTIAPGAEAKARMAKDIKPEVQAFVDQTLGGWYLNIDRAEAEGRVIFTIAPKAEASYMQRAIAAAQGKGSIAGNPGLTRVLGRDPKTTGVLAIDVREGLEWMRDLAKFGARTENLPQNLGTDLGDFYFTMRYAEGGAMVMEYVFSQQMITQIKALIPA